MMENSTCQPLSEKSFYFGVCTYKICDDIVKSKKEWILARQRMRSSSAIGALCAESEFAQSRPDFISKLSIARKECHESRYWIKMMTATGLMTDSIANKLILLADELMRLLTASIKTAQRKMTKEK